MSEKIRLIDKPIVNNYRIVKITDSNNEKSCVSTDYTQDEKSPPKDKYNLAYISFIVIGIGMLLPWNFFINADQYFKKKLSNEKNDLKLFESAFSICSQIPCGIALILNLYLTDRVSRKGRVLTTLIVSIACFILTTILVNTDTSSWTTRFFGVTLSSIVIINFCSGIFQGTMSGIAAATGARYIQGTIVGMSVAGTFASSANLISLAVDDDITIDATIYFTIATLVVFVCILVFIFMFRLKVLKARFTVKDDYNVDKDSVMSSTSSQSNQNVATVLKLTYPVALSVMCVFTVTLTIMPSILSGIRSVDASNGSPWTNKYFTGIVGFLIFNLGDFTGRIISGFVRIVDKKGPWLPIICILRIAFIPLFMLCNYQPRYNLPVAFNHDAFPVIFNILFSVSNGYLASLCMMFGPELVPRHLMEKAGATMQLFLTLGLGIGAVLSFLFVSVI